MATVAERFHVLPTVAAEAMDCDAEHLILESAEMLAYAEAKARLDSCRTAEKRMAIESPMVALVERIGFELAAEEIGQAQSPEPSPEAAEPKGSDRA